MRREAAAETPLDERGRLRRIDDLLWRFHRGGAVPGQLGAPQPSLCEDCDDMIAGVGGGFRLVSIVVGVKIRP